MPKLTKRVIDLARPQETERWLWDSELKGFGLRVYPDGRKLYVCQYRTAGGRRGRTRRVTLGAHGVLTPDQARGDAKQVLACVALGEDPAADRDAVRLTSALIGDYWLVADDNEMTPDILGASLPVFRFREVPFLRGLAAADLLAVAPVKRAFPTSEVVQ